MLLDILHLFNLHYYDEFKRIKHKNNKLRQRKNLFRDIARNKKREEILETYNTIERIKQIADAYILLEKIFI